MTAAIRNLPQIPASQDPFALFLDQLKPRNSLYCFSTLAAPWGLSLPAMPGNLMLHLITEGECIIETANTSLKLENGAIVLIPHGKGHIVRSDKNAAVVPFFESGGRNISPKLEILEISGRGHLTKLICGVVSFDPLIGHYLLAQLPEIMCLHQSDYSDSTWINSTIDLIQNEAQLLKVGSETIITRLAEILVVKVMRHWLENSPLANEGWFLAMRDNRVGAALRAMHQYPEQQWKLESLASLACMSRSAFAAKFTELTGISVKSYLTQWRLNLAHYQLQANKKPLIELALSSGYNSEAAFSRAFKRVIGISPSRVRQQN